jgi:hypothetical protein
LLWRLRLAGFWLTRPSGTSEQAVLDAAEAWLRGREDQPAVQPSLLPEYCIQPEIALRRAIRRILMRSPLGRMAVSLDEHGHALDRTVSLVLDDGTLEGGHRRTRRLPFVWRDYLAASFSPLRPRVSIPTCKPVWDPATWQLVAVLDSVWNADGVTFMGKQRVHLFQVLGTRRMARRYGWSWRRALACCRTAYEVWRYWFRTQEQPRLETVEALELPPALAETVSGPQFLYRHARAGFRTGTTGEDFLALLPPDTRDVTLGLAGASAASLRAPVVFGWTPPPLAPLAAALLRTPLGVLAARRTADRAALEAAAYTTTERVLRAMTAPWPWKPRPVVIGPRRAGIEARRKGGRLVMTAL